MPVMNSSRIIVAARLSSARFGWPMFADVRRCSPIVRRISRVSFVAQSSLVIVASILRRFVSVGFLNRWRVLVATMHKAVLLLGSSTRVFGKQYADRFAIRRSVAGVVCVVDRRKDRGRSMCGCNHPYFRPRRCFPQGTSDIY